MQKENSHTNEYQKQWNNIGHIGCFGKWGKKDLDFRDERDGMHLT